MGSRLNCPNRKLTTRLAPTQSPSMLDIAWAAGIYEGEGSVSGKNHNRTSTTVVVTQKDTWLLERLKQLFGGTTYKIASAPCSRWTLSGPRGRGFLYTIFPLLSPRRRAQIKDVLVGV